MGSALRNPEPRQVAERLGRSLSAALELYDLVIVGAGPSGLAAAVYGASEGLRTLLLDRHAPGGQAGSSSRIENYLGFPAGVSGSELTRRAVTQAQRLGAELLVPLEVTGVSIDGGIQAPDAQRRPRDRHADACWPRPAWTTASIPRRAWRTHTGAGVYYGAATTEAPAFSDRRVLVVGGGNSAGQAAMYLARYAKDVQIVVRRDSLRDTMSRYLIEQIEKTPNIRLRPRTRARTRRRRTATSNASRSSWTTARVRWRTIDAVFVFIGTRPRSDWLPAGVLRDAKGFVITGRDLPADARLRAHLEGAPRADAPRDQRARRVRGRRHPRRRHEPRRVSRGRRIDGRAIRRTNTWR